MNTTEIWDNNAWHDHISLPRKLSGHCLLKINSTHVFLAGGEFHSGEFSADAYLYSEEAGFVKQEDMMWSRGRVSCVLIEEGQVMVASTSSSWKIIQTQIFNLSTLGWSLGPNLPTKRESKMFSIDGKIFLIGLGDNKKIWQLERLELSTMSAWKWVEKGELKDERSDFDIVPITREYCAGNEN